MFGIVARTRGSSTRAPLRRHVAVRPSGCMGSPARPTSSSMRMTMAAEQSIVFFVVFAYWFLRFLSEQERVEEQRSCRPRWSPPSRSPSASPRAPSRGDRGPRGICRRPRSTPDLGAPLGARPEGGAGHARGPVAEGCSTSAITRTAPFKGRAARRPHRPAQQRSPVSGRRRPPIPLSLPTRAAVIRPRPAPFTTAPRRSADVGASQFAITGDADATPGPERQAGLQRLRDVRAMARERNAFN